MILQAQQIIAHLLTKTSVTNLLSDRIYLGVPIDLPSSNYLTLNIISDNTDTIAEKRGRIEFRFIGGTENTTFDTLNTIKDAVINELQINNIGDFKPHKINTAGFFNGYDELKRKFILQDLIFYYTY